MESENKRLSYIDGETLIDMRLPQALFCIETLLPQGVTILGGAPKIGKSWLVLDLCIRIAKGEEVWNLKTQKGSTLYLCLEDSYRRIQDRLSCITDDVPRDAYFSICSKSMTDGLCEQIRNFVSEHPGTLLIVIDTFQIIRKSDTEMSYANDYQEIRQMKQLADELDISLLLVHHLRKQGDSDPLNKLSGSTGISGAVDAVFVLDKSRRSHDGATLVCTGRDIEYREMELRFTKDHCLWELVSDSVDSPELLMPNEMTAFIDYMKSIGSYHGGNTELADGFNSFSGESISVKSLKQMMNKWRYRLEDSGVFFKSYRSNGQRLVEVSFSSTGDYVTGSDDSDSNDTKEAVQDICVWSVPSVTESEVTL